VNPRTKRFALIGVILSISIAPVALADNGPIEARLLHTFIVPGYHAIYAWKENPGAVSGAGDVNADGYDDLIVGAPLNSEAFHLAGKAYVYSGRTGDLLWSYLGEESYRQLGFSVSGAGDVDNDGCDDVIIGSPWNYAGETWPGKAYVYSGRTGEQLWTFVGEVPWEHFGYRVSDAGDVDGDGHADLLVGSLNPDGFEQNTGQVNIYSGRTGEVIWTFTGEGFHNHFGSALSGAGDVNADGYDDVIIGAFTWPDTAQDVYRTGKAYVYSGQTGELLYGFTGADRWHSFGYDVSAAGDIDLDSYDDIMVCAPASGEHSFQGNVFVYSGRTGEELLSITGFAFSDISDVGDINKDGRPDILVWSQYGFSAGGGTAHVFSGLNGEMLSTIGYRADTALACRFVSGAGDVNNDGYPDVIVGSDRRYSPNTGRAYVYSFAPNLPPVADAGPDQIAECSTGDGKAVVALNGSGSSDPDGDLLTYTWTGPFGTVLGVSPPVEVPLGTHTIVLTVEDGKGGVDQDEVLITVEDTTPPTTTATVAGELGNNDWYVSPVVVTLEATDACAEVEAIWYSLNGIPHDAPNPAQVTLTEGVHVLQFHATDQVGNEETIQELRLSVDLEGPEITISGIEEGATYELGLVPEATHEASDAISGVASSSATLTGGDEYGLGEFVYTVSAEDNAGNSSVLSVNYIVVGSIEGLLALLDQYEASGDLNAQFAIGLRAKLNDALNAPNPSAQNGMLGDFIDKVERQIGKKITAEAAAVLIHAAEFIINENLTNEGISKTVPLETVEAQGTPDQFELSPPYPNPSTPQRRSALPCLRHHTSL
jgi:hypothetical protein